MSDKVKPGRSRPKSTRVEQGTVVDRFHLAWRALDGPDLIAEHRFAPPRLFRFDFCDLYSKVAIELEGGVASRGWHQSIERYVSDCEKYNLAASLDWLVFRFTVMQLDRDPIGELTPVLAKITTRSRPGD